MSEPIWFNRPAVVGGEAEYMRAAMAAGRISGDGTFSRRCHELLAEITGAHAALLTTSCTHALEMAALLLEVQPGDEVICPPFTFVSTINAFVLRGARPVFVDIRPDTLNIDERRIEPAITPRTRAILVVHYGGVACEMDAITAIAARHNLPIVEDNAHGLFARYKGRRLGTFGRFATLSFHETKNVTCGEGGALLLNQPADLARAEILREKGTDRSRFFRGAVDRYTWVDVGSSYLPSDLLAAYLLAQLECHVRIQETRQAVWRAYQEGLGDWARLTGVGLPQVPPECEHPAHLFYLLLPSMAQRQALMAHLRALNVDSVFHYQPLHVSEMGRRFGGRPGEHPVTESVADRLLRLPLHYHLSAADVNRVIDSVRRFGPSLAEV
jgi:dTDP-4-amino-4,6-dideoxygalactose transaminase